MLRPLHEFTPEEMLTTLAERQAAFIDAEVEEAKGKAKFEAIQGATMEVLRMAGKPVEIVKKTMWSDPRLMQAHDEYLDVLREYNTAKAALHRADRAIQLFQTARADVRRV